ncbi:MAG TPA: hypothetical protein VJI33_05225 [Candidatus Paceibacterota bacterium]
MHILIKTKPIAEIKEKLIVGQSVLLVQDNLGLMGTQRVGVFHGLKNGELVLGDEYPHKKILIPTKRIEGVALIGANELRDIICALKEALRFLGFGLKVKRKCKPTPRAQVKALYTVDLALTF